VKYRLLGTDQMESPHHTYPHRNRHQLLETVCVAERESKDVWELNACLDEHIAPCSVTNPAPESLACHEWQRTDCHKHPMPYITADRCSLEMIGKRLEAGKMSDLTHFSAPCTVYRTTER